MKSNKKSHVNSIANNEKELNAITVKGAYLNFNDSSSAGSATIINTGSLFSFNDSSTAGSATITSNGGLIFKPVGDVRVMVGAVPNAVGSIQRVNVKTGAFTTLYATYEGAPLMACNDPGNGRRRLYGRRGYAELGRR